MGFFGTPRKKGVSSDEWEKKDRNRVRGVFGYSSADKRRADDVEMVLKGTLDADADSHGRGVMQAKEVDESLAELEKKKRITHDQAARVRRVLEDDLKD